MPIEFNPDNLDRYFKNQLSEVEKSAFEQKMAQDPLLQSEMNFQREVIEAICQKRKWELKQRLDALAPETTPIFTLPRLAFGSTLTLAGLVTATLFWFDSKKMAEAPKQSKQIVKIEDQKTKKEQSKEMPNLYRPKVEQNVTVQPKVAQNPVFVAPVAIQQPQNEKNTQNVDAPCLPESPAQAHDAVAVSMQDAMVKMYDEAIWFEVSNTDTDNGAFDRNSDDERSLDRLASSQMLRYQYYNGQLSLYNQSSAGKQIHTSIDGQPRHFLLHEEVYYEFFDGQTTQTVMQPVRDKQILKMLKDMFSQVNK
jgi:hypothetical protein